MGFKVAVVGATGNVGREMLNILEERGFPADEVVALASRRSQGTISPGWMSLIQFCGRFGPVMISWPGAKAPTWSPI